MRLSSDHFTENDGWSLQTTGDDGAYLEDTQASGRVVAQPKLRAKRVPVAPHFMITSANLEKIAEVRIFRASHAAEQGDERHCQDGVTSHIEGPSVSRAICRHGSCGESHEATAHAPG
jgi:hypothetical protein